MAYYIDSNQSNGRVDLRFTSTNTVTFNSLTANGDSANCAALKIEQLYWTGSWQISCNGLAFDASSTNSIGEFKFEGIVIPLTGNTTFTVSNTVANSTLIMRAAKVNY
jgi:hypothetical protein